MELWVAKEYYKLLLNTVLSKKIKVKTINISKTFLLIPLDKTA